MTDRSHLIENFLADTIAAQASRKHLAGDASNRRYERLTLPDRTTLVLMDAPPQKDEDVRPFIRMAKHLSKLGFSSPKIIAQDEKNGLLLLEDLGDDIYARVIDKDRSAEEILYNAAVDVLVELHKTPAPKSLGTFDPATMADAATDAWRWYRRGAGLEYEETAAKFERSFTHLLKRHANDTSILIQRDYHAENLLWLTDRSGIARVGLLDFQDALAGHPAYDLVSLLQDARRDVSLDIEAKMIDRYIEKTGVSSTDFHSAYHVVGVQRHLRVIAVFARLSLHFGKTSYIDFLPRVWGYLERDLKHPALAPISEQILIDLPPPTPELMQRLKDQCATIPFL